MTTPSIAVIGAGFSGTLLALHLLRRCPPHTRVTLIERNRRFGRGMAYSTGNPNHLLNVPAGRMSAFHDRPHDFLDWLQRQPEEELGGLQPNASSFAPRHLFGAYIRSLLNEEIRAPESRDRLVLVRGDVQAIDRSGHPIILHLDRGEAVEADLAVLAVGNFPPRPPPIADPSFYDSALYRPDPWAAEALADLDPASRVLLIGTGLTTVDMVVSLLDQGHTGPIHAVSRRGLLPRRHQAGPPAALAEPIPFPTGLMALTRTLRREAERAIEQGGTWQPVVDALRPFTQDVWQAMSLTDRARFLRHMRPWWDVHRHRMAGPVADRIDAARQSGQLQLHTGRIQGYALHDGMADVRYRPRGSDRMACLQAARVINCSGPDADYARIGDTLIRGLLLDGTVRPDALRLGLDVTGTCALLNASGAISRRLFAVGPVTKGTFWEMTAVPDIRRQCELLAQHLAALVGAPAVIAQPVSARPEAFTYMI
ncbi:FAD/NAD(P)-binding protein [Limobrevibacterium gyesilva]|uniref:FAD-dependent oxidoreductase n=1 Tax=Limobrevibacterium gyesilva TaxID=2991712 RepID=A0AA41YL76_9PROT|nr:FAD-dependent oxidoreductase [Limobrevibacterium gyesilva]